MLIYSDGAGAVPSRPTSATVVLHLWRASEQALGCGHRSLAMLLASACGRMPHVYVHCGCRPAAPCSHLGSSALWFCSTGAGRHSHRPQRSIARTAACFRPIGLQLDALMTLLMRSDDASGCPERADAVPSTVFAIVHAECNHNSPSRTHMCSASFPCVRLPFWGCVWLPFWARLSSAVHVSWPLLWDRHLSITCYPTAALGFRD